MRSFLARLALPAGLVAAVVFVLVPATEDAPGERRSAAAAMRTGEALRDRKSVV